MPHNTFDITTVKSIEDLPVFNVGCDSSAAWSKKYRHLCEEYDEDELYVSLKLDGGYRQKHLVITGGEPLLKKHQKFWVVFLNKFGNLIENITFETNGTQVLTEDLLSTLSSIKSKITFSVSPKLSLSGELNSKACIPPAIHSYHTVGYVYLKYVIRDEVDIKEVKAFTDAYNVNGNFDVYLMPEGATIEGLELTERNVADLALEHGFYFSPRLHCHLYGNSWGT
jgi:organic radical activating enzyme